MTTGSVIGPCHLVTLTIDTLIYRLITAPGYVSYGGQTYFSKTDDGQQIMGLGDVTEGSAGLSNCDLKLIATSSLVAKLYDQTYLKGTVTIQEGNRNPATDVFIALGGLKTWEIGSFDLSYVGDPVTLVLKSSLARLIEPYDALTTSSQSQEALTSTLDLGLDYISGPVTSSPKDNGGSYPPVTNINNDRGRAYDE